MAFVWHQYQQCKNNNKGNQVHHSPYYHSFHIVHAASQIGMISAENGYRNIVADHVIGGNKQKDKCKQRYYDLAFKLTDCPGVFTFSTNSPLQRTGKILRFGTLIKRY